MLNTRATIALGVVTGVCLELGIHALSGRREAWDSSLYWTVGLPIAGVISAAAGFLSRGADWKWMVVIVPSQVLTMMLRSGELGNLWPLALIVGGLLSTPFVLAAFIGSRFRRDA